MGTENFAGPSANFCLWTRKKVIKKQHASWDQAEIDSDAKTPGDMIPLQPPFLLASQNVPPAAPPTLQGISDNTTTYPITENNSGFWHNKVSFGNGTVVRVEWWFPLKKQKTKKTFIRDFKAFSPELCTLIKNNIL